MTRFLAGVLSVIAAGLMLIAYGLLRPGPAAYAPQSGAAPGAWPAGYVQGAHQGAYYPGAYANAYGQAAYGQAAHGQGAYAPGLVYTVPQGAMTGAGVPMVAVPASNMPVMAVPTAAAPQVVEVRSAPAPRQVVRTTASRPDRNWTKTALIIGGSTAAGAGIGGIFGGKKGALIGAAIGGGASSIQQATR